jgi:hypothetical protein
VTTQDPQSTSVPADDSGALAARHYPLYALSALVLIGVTGVILYQQSEAAQSAAHQVALGLSSAGFWQAAGVGLVAQIVDGALGMAYGITSTSFLLSVGVPPAAASASVHLAEVFTTGFSGLSHWKLGNVNTVRTQARRCHASHDIHRSVAAGARPMRRPVAGDGAERRMADSSRSVGRTAPFITLSPRRTMFGSALAVLAWCVPLATSGADEASSLKLSGSMRLRQETLHGQFRPGFDAHDHMLSVRTSVLAEWSRGDWRLVGELSDSRAYDTDAGGLLTSNEVNTLEPVQAYVQRSFRAPFGEGTTATLLAGRFLFNLGSRRLIASDEYRNTPQGSTGLRADVSLAGNARWTLFFVMPQQRRPDDFASLRDNEPALDHEGFDQLLWGGQFAKPGVLPGGALAELAYVGFRERDNGGRSTRDRRLHSFDVRALREPRAGQFDYELEGIWQVGRIRASTAGTASDLDVRAFFLHADAGYSFSTPARARLSVEYDYASGDGPGTRYRRFDTLFGMRRADVGPSGIYGLLGRTNLESLGVRLEAAPGKRLDLMVSWRLTWAAASSDSFSTSNVRDPSGASGRFAGTQLDGRIRYWILPQRLRAEVNAVWFDRGGLLRDAPNATPHGDPLYLAVAITLSH